MSEPVEIVIGNAETERLIIRVLDRAHPDADDYWDGNWLRTVLDVSAGYFAGSVAVDLRADELKDLREQLATLYEASEGEASFTTMENWVEILFHRDSLGHVQVRGEVSDNPGRMGNSLRFQYALDQTFLPPIIDALDAAEASWPVIGRP